MSEFTNVFVYLDEENVLNTSESSRRKPEGLGEQIVFCISLYVEPPIGKFVQVCIGDSRQSLSNLTKYVTK